MTYKYKLVSYLKETKEKHMETKSNNLDYFKRFLNKENYKNQIFEKVDNKWKLIFSD